MGDVPSDSVPRHIAIIMDGNGRWAKSRGLPRAAGHRAGAETVRGDLPALGEAVWSAAENLREATEWILTQELDARFAVAVPYLRAFARVLGGHYHLRAAHSAGGEGPRMALAEFYVTRLLPEHDGLLRQVRVGDKGLYDLSVDALLA